MRGVEEADIDFGLIVAELSRLKYIADWGRSIGNLKINSQ